VRSSDGQGWLQNRRCVKWAVIYCCCILIYASVFNEIHVHPPFLCVEFYCMCKMRFAYP
jgi:hypothetical protein